MSQNYVAILQEKRVLQALILMKFFLLSKFIVLDTILRLETLFFFKSENRTLFAFNFVVAENLSRMKLMCNNFVNTIKFIKQAIKKQQS